jgi:hypothetical protein
MARSLILSDQASDRPTLDEASRTLQAGGQVAFEESVVSEWAEKIHAGEAYEQLPLGCTIVWYSPIVIMIALFIALLVALAYLKWWVA